MCDDSPGLRVFGYLTQNDTQDTFRCHVFWSKKKVKFPPPAPPRLLRVEHMSHLLQARACSGHLGGLEERPGGGPCAQSKAHPPEGLRVPASAP